MKPSLLLLMLIGLPLVGVWSAGYSVADYLEFPPLTRYVRHAPFSWPVFMGLSAAIAATVLPFLIRIVTTNISGRHGGTDAVCPGGEASKRFFPWWGWLAVGLGAHTWILAWTRQLWFEAFQPYTFTPLWIAYIVVINALTYRRAGRCLLTHQTGFLLKLFPLSAAFWWFFEYLNRFVQNWWYVLGTDLNPLQYFIAATLPFSTVLPAVLCTEEWLAGHPRCSAGLKRFVSIRVPYPKPLAWSALLLSAVGLLLIGHFPDQLFPLLWVAPLILLTALQTLTGGPALFPELADGDWRRIYRFALAALICGFFWEMWNLHCLAKWIYSVPYVDRFHLFEMPLLGYAGYLPFGIECLVIVEVVLRPGK